MQDSRIRARLNEYLTHKGLTLKGFLYGAGVSESYFRTYNGHPTLRIKRKFASSYPDLNVDYLFDGVGSMLQEPKVVKKSQSTIINTGRDQNVNLNTPYEQGEELIKTLRARIRAQEMEIEHYRNTIEKLLDKLQ